MEHAPNGLESVLAQLQAVAAYPVTPVVRVPIGDVVTIKQVLDLGAQNILVPMVSPPTKRAPRSTRCATRRAGAAAWAPRSPGRRAGTGSTATSPTPTPRLAVRADRDGGGGGCRRRDRRRRRRRRRLRRPSDLAASMGLLGQQTHPDVDRGGAARLRGRAGAGKPVGVNAFDPAVARAYVEAGASFVLVGADVRCSLEAPRPSPQPSSLRSTAVRSPLRTEAPASVIPHSARHASRSTGSHALPFLFRCPRTHGDESIARG